jgi:hypothetical protein
MRRFVWVLLLASVWLGASRGVSAQTAVPPSSGDGLSTDTAYQITELGNLVWLHDQADASATTTTGVYYKLMNDIDASATAGWNDAATSTVTLEGFNPVGASAGMGKSFKGIFLGEGHTISNLHICRTTTSWTGLFGSIAEGGRVINVHLVGGSVVGTEYVGGLVGMLNIGSVSGCSNTGTVTGSGDSVGGLIGANTVGTNYTAISTVSKCHATGAVTGNTGSMTDAGGIGGLIGSNDSVVSECYATCDVRSVDICVGGLIGNNVGGSVTECHATGTVVGGEYVGGLIGGSSGSNPISKCYATGDVTGNDNSIGGLIGRFYFDGVLSRCYATGNVTGYYNLIGGLVGASYQGCTISDCYATGDVTGHDTQVGSAGGLVGGGSGGAIFRCYSIGAVSGGAYTGGLIGWGAQTMTDTYWNTQTSGQTAAFGQTTETSSGGTGLTTLQMKQQASFANWDFTATPVWGIQGAYPYLADLTTCTLTYAAGAGGKVADGLTTGTTQVQVINLASTGTPVTATPNQYHKFAYWSDALVLATRIDAGLTDDMSVTAIFDERRAAAREWPLYR